MRKTTLALAAGAALLTAAPAADAADYAVTGGKLDWTIANQMTSFGDPARSWLGYVTFNQVGNPGSSNGTAGVTAPATLTGPAGAAATTVTPDSARGADQTYTFGYPVSTGGKYTDKGVNGLAAGKRVIVTISRGGFYGADTPSAAGEHLETYLRWVFGFIGIHDPEIIVAEGIQVSPEHREKAMADALQAATSLRAA